MKWQTLICEQAKYVILLTNTKQTKGTHDGPSAAPLGPAFRSADVDTPRGTERGPYLRHLRVAGCGVSDVDSCGSVWAGRAKQN